MLFFGAVLRKKGMNWETGDENRNVPLTNCD